MSVRCWYRCTIHCDLQKTSPFINRGREQRCGGTAGCPVQVVFCPALDDASLEGAYFSACKAAGFCYGFIISPRSPATTFFSEDPDRCRKEIGGYLLYDALAYRAWHHPTRRAYAESGATTLEELKREGKLRSVLV